MRPNLRELRPADARGQSSRPAHREVRRELAMKKILILVATILLTVGVKYGESASLPAPRNPSSPHLVVIAYLVLLDHVVSSHPVSKKTVPTSDKLKPNPLVPRVLPARVGLW